MSADKLVDSTQLDADLTSVANAIRTKGGTSASLAFPADFITAINAISGGGGVTAATGEIVIASYISSPSATASKTFPGLSLNFVPDILFISMDNATWDDVASAAANNTIYWIMVVKKTLVPVLRFSTSLNSDDATFSGFDYLAFGVNTAFNSASNPTSYGIPSAITLVDATRLPYWKLNNDGTFDYGRFNNSSQTNIYAGTYNYFAFKV